MLGHLDLSTLGEFCFFDSIRHILNCFRVLSNAVHVRMHARPVRVVFDTVWTV